MAQVSLPGSRQIVAGLLAALVLLTASSARADPPPTRDPEPSWAKSTTKEPPPSRRRKLVSAGAVAATYAIFSTWAYFAWFRNANFDGGGGITFDGFDVDSYAGGADKAGHFWTGYTLSRATTAFLVYGGWPRLPSSLVASGLSQVFLTLSEIEDSFVYQFEGSDIIANLAGAAFSVLLVNVPAVDRLVDFRVEYFPSSDYRRRVEESQDLDIAQDYSGQSYMLALHLDAIPRLTDPVWLSWVGYVDVVAGFETRNYSPPADDPDALRRQTLYIGAAFNLQHVLRRLFCDSTGRRLGEGVFELVSVPFTTLHAAEASRTPASDR